MECPKCNGKGKLAVQGLEATILENSEEVTLNCDYCAGSGNIPDSPPHPSQCTECKGRGSIVTNNDTSKCPACYGSGISSA